MSMLENMFKMSDLSFALSSVLHDILIEQLLDGIAYIGHPYSKMGSTCFS